MPRLHSPLWPDHRIKPPYGSVEVDWGHPLAQGLRACWLFNEPGGSFCADMAGRVPMTLVGGTRTPYGVYFNGTSEYGIAANSSVIAAQRPMTIWAWFTRVATSDVNYIIGHRGAGGASAGWNLGIRIDATNIQGTFYAVADTYASAAPGASIPHLVIWTIEAGGAYAYYLDGLPVGTGTIAAPVVATNSLVIGARTDASNNVSAYGKGTVGPCGIAWRAYTANDALQLYADPYCFLREVKRRSYGFVGAAAGGEVTWWPWATDRKTPRGIGRGICRGM
jgi:hypothetical protein